MQGWPHWIPTEKKIGYINQLMKVGFDTLDCASFVSPKAIPQMADATQVIPNIDLENSATELLSIVANERGAAQAVAFDQISYLGFPFSVSETFQQRNTNSSIEDSLKRVEAIKNLCAQHNKELVVYISMGFGNPYGDPYNEEIVYRWVNKLVGSGIQIISLADTVGLATSDQVRLITETLIKALPHTEIGVHLHSTSLNWKQKLDAALEAGCKRFDGALKGIGGCPMANDDLVGNMDSELMIPYFQQQHLLKPIDEDALFKSSVMASSIFQ
jgi:hydroxymethylglutaryl-CoA lyase